MNDLSLSYQLIGEGPPLLLVHGFGISFEIWKALAPLLRSHFTLVMVELPGIGKSPMVRGNYLLESVNALERLRLNLGFEKWDVLGYSTGSRIAEAYVQTFASHTGHAIFLCPLYVGLVRTIGLRLLLWSDNLIPAIGSLVLSGWRLRFLISLFGFNLHPNPLADEWFGLINVVPLNVLKDTLRMATRLGLQKVKAPIPFSLVWGESDLIVVRPFKHDVHDRFLKTNHAMPMLAADEVAKIVLDVLKK